MSGWDSGGLNTMRPAGKPVAPFVRAVRFKDNNPGGPKSFASIPFLPYAGRVVLK